MARHAVAATGGLIMSRARRVLTAVALLGGLGVSGCAAYGTGTYGYDGGYYDGGYAGANYATGYDDYYGDDYYYDDGYDFGLAYGYYPNAGYYRRGSYYYNNRYPGYIFGDGGYWYNSAWYSRPVVNVVYYEKHRHRRDRHDHDRYRDRDHRDRDNWTRNPRDRDGDGKYRDASGTRVRDRNHDGVPDNVRPNRNRTGAYERDRYNEVAPADGRNRNRTDARERDRYKEVAPPEGRGRTRATVYERERTDEVRRNRQDRDGDGVAGGRDRATERQVIREHRTRERNDEDIRGNRSTRGGDQGDRDRSRAEIRRSRMVEPVSAPASDAGSRERYEGRPTPARAEPVAQPVEREAPASELQAEPRRQRGERNHGDRRRDND
jgi:hypothetical protein